MQFPKLYRLRKAISNLDVNFIAKKIDLLEMHLDGKGQSLEPNWTALTEEGIFYISADTGMSTKVVLYLADLPGETSDYQTALLPIGTDKNPVALNWRNEYHILRCNTLRERELQTWVGNYRIAQRTNGTFSCRVQERVMERKKIVTHFHDVEDQRLEICESCFVKAKSLLAGVKEVSRENFDLARFFDVDFTRSWSRQERYVEDKSALDAIHPRDWADISLIRKHQVQFYCESCEMDLSHRDRRKFLYVHHSDHIKRKLSYVKLECLCIGCLADLPSHAYLKERPEYLQYQKILGFLETNGAHVSA